MKFIGDYPVVNCTSVSCQSTVVVWCGVVWCGVVCMAGITRHHRSGVAVVVLLRWW